MTIRIGINGFGRIGRNILRALMESRRTDIEVVAINDLGPVGTNARLLRYDSVHGPFPGVVTVEDDRIEVGRGPIRVTATRSPDELPWGDVDVALECSGRFVERESAARHLANGSKRVLVSAPCKGADRTVVYVVNHDAINEHDRVISNASCTTNCLAPLAQVLHRAVGIETGFMTTIHSYTSDQPTLDTMHNDLYRSRAASLSMVPTSTGAAKAVGLVLPDLAGRLDGIAIRVPTPNVSAVDFKFLSAKSTSVGDVAEIIRCSASGELNGIIGYTEEQNVSVDFNHDPRSSVVHIDQIRVSNGSFVRVMSWYDNEWAFSNRMLDAAATIGRTL